MESKSDNGIVFHTDANTYGWGATSIDVEGDVPLSLFDSIANASEVPKRSPLDKAIPARSVFAIFFILKPQKFVIYIDYYIEITL
ncbi:hypothetical protein ACT453_50125, partial [Bacillus sp. D-CC]